MDEAKNARPKGEPSRRSAPAPSSPYSTGAGGVTFERRVASFYLAALLNGETAPGLDGRRVVEVAFQRAPTEPVDDLVLSAQGDGETAPSLVVAVGVRRRPAITTTDRDTQKLLTDYLRSLHQPQIAGVEREYFLIVAGPQRPASQVALLASLARTSTEEAFFPLVREPGRFERIVRTRLDHLVALVTAGLTSLSLPHTDAYARSATWKLLRRLTVLQPRYEAPDPSDWEALVNALQARARSDSPDGGRALRDRMETLAATYSPQAATIDQMMLLRDVHPLLSHELTRFHPGWVALRTLEAVGRAAIRSTIGQTPGSSGTHLDRTDARDAIRDLIGGPTTLIVHGDSGSGKSALILDVIDTEKAQSADEFDAIYLNLRQLPATGVSLDLALGAPISDLLRVMNAPRRALIIDGADYLAESASTAFTWLVHAAATAAVNLVVVNTTETAAAVKAELGPTATPVEYRVAPLDDAELGLVVAGNSGLRGLLASTRSKELLRRPVVADLLARTQTTQTAANETEAMGQVWASLVRRNERNDHAAPDARDRVLKNLAEHALGRFDDNHLLGLLDYTVVDALRRDGLLAPASTSPWQRVPEFFHEQLRLYAVSQVLLSRADPVTELITASAPRWTLPAARLAAQFLLAAGDSPENPLHGRLERVQAQFERLPDAGFGSRWADLPIEALLPLVQSRDLLVPAWASLVADDGVGLARIFRLIQQRHAPIGLVDPAVSEPIVSALLEHGWPRESNKDAEQLIRDWLRALILANVQAGHELRVKLLYRIVERVANADAAAEAAAQAARDALAARTPEQVAEDEARITRLPVMSGSIGYERKRRRKHRDYLPSELTDDAVVEQLALLGPDLGATGEGLLRRIAEHSPADLQPALEEPFGGRALASCSPPLLVELAEAYYIDDIHPEDDDFGWAFRDDGVRDHGHRGGMLPFSSAYRGPFLPMLQTDFPGGVAFITKLLNHAALCRVKGFRRWQDGSDPVTDNSTSLAITGEPQQYIGDSQVWLWYRAGGVGPYPCMSALQALEVVADQLLDAGLPITRLVELLMADCANLAMPGLLVGILERHIESAGALLDPYLAEPDLWHLEFGRAVQEQSRFLAKSDSIHGADRRTWSFREVAAMLALNANPQREAELDAVAEQLEQRARADLQPDPTVEPEEGITRQIAIVVGWASGLRRSSYQMKKTDEGVYFESTVPAEVSELLEPGRADSERISDAYRLINRHVHPRHPLSGPPDIDLAELHDDVTTAQELLELPQLDGPTIADACAAVAGSVLEHRFLRGAEIDDDDLVWAAELLLDIASAFAEHPEQDVYEFSYFSQSPDIPASRTVALLLRPDAARLRELLGEKKGIPLERIVEANRWAATYGSLVGRLLSSRSLDHIWPLDPIQLPAGQSSHDFAVSLIEESVRGAIVGDWDQEGQVRSEGRLLGPLVEALAEADPELIIAERLLPGVRGLQVLAVQENPLGAEALRLLTALLTAYATARQQDEFGPQHSQTDMLTITRALLVLSSNGKPELSYRHLEAFIDRNDLLDEFMDAIAAAAEENDAAAAAAAEIWPRLMNHALNLMDLGHVPVGDGSLAARGIASLLPNPTYSNGYLLRELSGPPIGWIEFDTISPHIDRWIPYAAGRRESVDQLIGLLRLTSMQQQMHPGLPWVEALVLPDPAAISGRSYLLPEWLKETSSAVRATPDNHVWQRIVDLLVVAGEERVADLTD